MGLNIKNDEVHTLVAELARLRNVSMTSAVRDAVRAELEKERNRRSRAQLGEQLLAIGRRCAAHMKRKTSSADHAELYDSRGLPR